MARAGAFKIGCSGWQYGHWKGNFYPAELPLSRWLEYYARHFDTVEVNNSFYRLPQEGVFESWRARTPARFLFAVKASRFLTHMKKLKDPEEPVGRLFSRAVELRSKLGPVLYQLPKQMPKNIERLSAFLSVVALCLHDMPGSKPPRLLTARFTYVRFHGASGRYNGAYPIDVLEDWAKWLEENNVAAFLYFNNDIGGHAPRDARKLIQMLAARKNLDGPRMNRHVPVPIG